MCVIDVPRNGLVPSEDGPRHLGPGSPRRRFDVTERREVAVTALPRAILVEFTVTATFGRRIHNRSGYFEMYLDQHVSLVIVVGNSMRAAEPPFEKGTAQ